MKLRVRKGAVIELLVDSKGDYNLKGAVVALDENEIVLRPQSFVAKETYRGTGFISYENIDPLRTMDGPHSDIHVDRNRIIGWVYFKMPNEKTSASTMYSGYYDYREVENDKLHFYDKDGICQGYGAFLED